MEVISLLKQYKDITPQIQDLNAMINELLQQQNDGVKAVTISDMPKAAARVHDRLAEIAVRNLDEIDKYASQVNELMDKQKLINHMLMQLDTLERQVIMYRYIDNPPYRCDIWDYISRKICYSYSQTRRIHDRAIEKMDKWYKT